MVAIVGRPHLLLALLGLVLSPVTNDTPRDDYGVTCTSSSPHLQYVVNKDQGTGRLTFKISLTEVVEVNVSQAENVLDDETDASDFEYFLYDLKKLPRGRYFPRIFMGPVIEQDSFGSNSIETTAWTPEGSVDTDQDICEDITSDEYLNGEEQEDGERGGYLEVLGHGYYRIHYTRKNWEDARRTCEQENAHLMLSEDDVLREYLVNVAAPCSRMTGESRYYVGYRLLSDGTVVSVYGQKKLRVLTNEHATCCTLTINKRVQCDTELPFICEKNR